MTFALFALLAVILNYGLIRTQWGRSMFAVGGNQEAARRSGINVRRIYLSALMLCSTLAALGGILSASRLASSSQQAGTGDVNLNAIAAAVIGGTSLFGGRGSAWSAVLRIIVIQAISNGLTLLNLSSSLRYKPKAVIDWGTPQVADTSRSSIGKLSSKENISVPSTV